MRAPSFRAYFADELVVDSFAGGGGTSTGIEAALNGRSPDEAINHDAIAIAMHKANHPRTRHHCESIYDVNPVAVCAGRRVGLLWLSPDCTHFSRAKGTQPRRKEIRGLAWIAVDWARAVRPRVIMLENVEEFATWGPLDDSGRPIREQLGATFREWVSQLQALGYVVEYRSLVAADYGTPTTRRRLFLVARCDGHPIVWPEQTHGRGCLYPWRPASEIIDWRLACPSIFDRKRPLAPATLARVAKGTQRFAINSPNPFIVRHGHYSTITGAGLREGCGAGTFRGQSLSDPLGTVCATNDKHLVIPFIAKHYGGVVGHRVDRPLGTITAWDHHSLVEARVDGVDRSDLVRAFLTKFYGTSTGSPLQEPMPTITGGGGHIGLVTVRGEKVPINDIGMRMLQPPELFAAQGFPSDYVITPMFHGKPITKTAQTALAGNSVCPQVAAALVRANAYAASMAVGASA